MTGSVGRSTRAFGCGKKERAAVLPKASLTA